MKRPIFKFKDQPLRIDPSALLKHVSADFTPPPPLDVFSKMIQIMEDEESAHLLQLLLNPVSESELLDKDIGPKLCALVAVPHQPVLASLIADWCLLLAERLVEFARDGDPESIRALAHLALTSTSTLGPVLKNSPHVLADIARSEYRWPLLISPISSASQPVPDWDRMELGSSFPFHLKKRRIRLCDPVTQLALRLWQFVAEMRWLARKEINEDNGKFEAIRRKRNRNPLENAAVLPEWHSTRQNERSTIAEWAKAAQTFLAEGYPPRNQNLLFDALHEDFKNIIKARRDNHPSRLASRIWERIEERFYTFGGVKVKKK